MKIKFFFIGMISYFLLTIGFELIGFESNIIIDLVILVIIAFSFSYFDAKNKLKK